MAREPTGFHRSQRVCAMECLAVRRPGADHEGDVGCERRFGASSFPRDPRNRDAQSFKECDAASGSITTFVSLTILPLVSYRCDRGTDNTRRENQALGSGVIRGRAARLRADCKPGSCARLPRTSVGLGPLASSSIGRLDASRCDYCDSISLRVQAEG